MFKIGDKVEIVNPSFIDKEYKGDIVTIEKIDESLYSNTRYFVEENIRPWVERELKLVEEYKMKKKNLKDGDIVTLRNGDRLALIGGSFCDLSDDYNNNLSDLYDLDDNLKYEKYGHNDKEYDIVKVERPGKYETVFERKEEVQELTVDEISERLGYKVKVVGEDR